MCFPSNVTAEGIQFCLPMTQAPTLANSPTMAPADPPPDEISSDGTKLWSIPEEGVISFGNSITRSWDGGAKVVFSNCLPAFCSFSRHPNSKEHCRCGGTEQWNMAIHQGTSAPFCLVCSHDRSAPQHDAANRHLVRPSRSKHFFFGLGEFKIHVLRRLGRWSMLDVFAVLFLVLAIRFTLLAGMRLAVCLQFYVFAVF